MFGQEPFSSPKMIVLGSDIIAIQECAMQFNDLNAAKN